MDLEPQWPGDARDRLRARWWVRKKRQKLPVAIEFTDSLDRSEPPPGPEETVPSHAEVVLLDHREAWVMLHRRFTVSGLDSKSELWYNSGPRSLRKK